MDRRSAILLTGRFEDGAVVLPKAYAEAVRRAGGEPVILPADCSFPGATTSPQRSTASRPIPGP